MYCIDSSLLISIKLMIVEMDTGQSGECASNRCDRPDASALEGDLWVADINMKAAFIIKAIYHWVEFLMK